VIVRDEIKRIPNDRIPGTYYMFAGLVLVPCSAEHVADMMKAYLQSYEEIANFILNGTEMTKQTFVNQQAISVTCILPHQINQFHSEQLSFRADLYSVNDTPIYHMWDLVETIEKLKTDKAEWIKFRLIDGTQFTFSLVDALAATEEIMAENNIPKCWDKIEQISRS
jgi:PDZ domain